MGIADGEYERHLPVPWREGIGHRSSLARSAFDRPDCATADWLRERPDVGCPGAATALFPDRRHPGEPGTDRDAQLRGSVDGRWAALDFGCEREHYHGAFPRVRGRHAAAGATQDRICDAKLDHRIRRRSFLSSALHSDQLVWSDRQWRTWSNTSHSP